MWVCPLFALQGKSTLAVLPLNFPEAKKILLVHSISTDMTLNTFALTTAPENGVVVTEYCLMQVAEDTQMKLSILITYNV